MVKKVFAAPLSNPAIDVREGTYQQVSQNPLGHYLARLWWTLVIVGGLGLLIFLIWGGIDWLMSEGDAEKLKAARSKIIHALFGMGLLATSFALIKLLDAIFGLDILNLEWPTP